MVKQKDVNYIKVLLNEKSYTLDVKGVAFCTFSNIIVLRTSGCYGATIITMSPGSVGSSTVFDFAHTLGSMPLPVTFVIKM